MSKRYELAWNDENGDDWTFQVQISTKRETSVDWEIDAWHGSSLVCEMVITSLSEAYPPKLRDVAESMAHHFIGVALKMVEAG